MAVVISILLLCIITFKRFQFKNQKNKKKTANSIKLFETFLLMIRDYFITKKNLLVVYHIVIINNL